MRLPHAPGSQPQPHANGSPVPVPGLLRRLTHWLRGVLRTKYRGLTEYEAELVDAVDRLKIVLHQRDEEIFNLKMALEEKKSEALILSREVELLNDVHERDRLRVQRDQSLYAAAIALATPAEARQEAE